MSEMTRRTLLTAAVAASVAQAQHQHVAAPSITGIEAFRFLQPDEFHTLQILCDLIIPADDHSPAAREAGAAEYIDLLSGKNHRLALIFRGGMAWLNARSQALYGNPFAAADVQQQTELLETIAYRDRNKAELKYGMVFFDWARRMTMDAFYTSKAGIADLGYMGNKGMTEFHVPAEALQQALSRL
jgi:gluconate 2-dehydrogenase gamma chain